MLISSNMAAVLGKVLGNFQAANANLQSNLRTAAQDAQVLIVHRVQQKGEGSKGRLQTKAVLRSAAYSRSHAKRRQKMGRQISKVDLTLHGDLMRNYQVIRSEPTVATVGFLDPRQAEIAEHLSDYYGQEIFHLSDNEERIIVNGVEQRFLSILNR